MLVMTLLFCVVPAVAEEAVLTTPGAKSAPCKDLKPFKNLDELLYQFYINLDSDCLFTMPVAELEKVWGIKILSDEKLKPGQKYDDLKNNADFRGKPYNRSEKNAFYLEIRHHKRSNFISFSIRITKEYLEKFGTLFPWGNYPKLIPEPIKKPNPKSIHITGRGNPSKSERLSITPGKYSDNNNCSYYWLNSDQTHMIDLEGIMGSVVGITMQNKVFPAFITNVDK